MGFFKSAINENDFVNEMENNLSLTEQKFDVLAATENEFNKAADMLDKVANDKEADRLSKLVIKLAHEIDLRELGLAMMNWHGGQWDPAYMCASYFVDGKDYPDLDVVERAKNEFEKLHKFEHGRFVEIKGDEDKTYINNVKSNVKELEYICDGLEAYLASKQITTQDNNEAQDKEKDEELFEDT